MTDGRRIRLDLAYRGTNYCGWQRQNHCATVQGEIEVALHRIVGEPVTIRGSSRTDAGVHALHQVAALNTTGSSIPSERFAPALNANLPPDIRVFRSMEVSPDFDPVGDCTRKRYCYLIGDGPVTSPFLAGVVWDDRFGTLDADAMHTAAQTFLGEHDFASFQSEGSPRQSTVRRIYNISVKRCTTPIPFGPLGLHNENLPQVIVFEVEGNGFLYKMVRTMAGTLAAIGHGKRSVDWVAEVIAAKDRRTAGITAPAEGLYLTGITF
ncbi:MAG: tRNA pseudouridine(38-40) synthase TruA [Planctomycetaceae bacterium]|nr:tRNA pseudouridine(38-40) synthase TruA [Planctomycetaceae bacterium]